MLSFIRNSGIPNFLSLAELAQQFRDARTKVVFCMEYALSTVLDTQKQCPLLKVSINTNWCTWSGQINMLDLLFTLFRWSSWLFI